MTAEDILDKVIPYEGNYRYYTEELVIEAMESYHQAKVEAISDEEIIEESIKNSDRYYDEFQYAAKECHSKGARWFKNKLIKP
jgi:hypothetical protein